MRRRLWGVATISMVALAVACAPPTVPPPVVTTEWPGTVTQGRTIGTTGTEWGGLDHNDDWLVRSRAGVDGTLTAAETVLTPRTGPGVGDLGAPVVLSPTYYSHPLYQSPLVSRPYLGTHLLLAGGDGVTAANRIFVEQGGTWTVGGTYALNPNREVVVAFSDSYLVTRDSAASADLLQVHPIDVTGGVVTVGPAVSVSLPASWSDYLRINGELAGNTLVVAGSDPIRPGAETALAVADLSDPTVTALTQVWTGGDLVLTSFDLDVDGSVTRAAVGVEASQGSGTVGRVMILSPTGSGPWATTAVLTPPAGLPDIGHGTYFGRQVALDDGLLVTLARFVARPSPASTGTSNVGVLGAYRLVGGVWQFEASMTPAPDVITTPETSRLPAALDVAGTVVHVEISGSDEGAPPAPTFAESWMFGS